MKRNHGFETNQGTNEQSQQQEIYEEVDMPELYTYDKTPKSEHGIVQNSREQQYQCCYRMLWGTMATIVVLIAILTSITLIVASVDFQASRIFKVNHLLYIIVTKGMAIIFECSCML